MKLYHVNLEVGNIIKEFDPKIPLIRLRDGSENFSIPRICLSASLNGCLSAVYWGGASFEDIFIDCDLSVPIRVYEFDTDDIDDNNLVTPEYLYKSDEVRDAMINQEYWVINQNLKPRKTYVIKISDYDESCEDDISYEDLEYCNNNEDEDIEAYIDGIFTTIQATYKIVEDENILYTDTLKIPVEYLLKEKNDQSLQILFLINNFVPEVIRESNECPIFSECANNIIIKFSKPYGFLKKELFDYIKNEL